MLVFALPEFRFMAETGKARVAISPVRVIGYLGSLVIYVCLAGVVAVVVRDAQHAKQAIACLRNGLGGDHQGNRRGQRSRRREDDQSRRLTMFG